MQEYVASMRSKSDQTVLIGRRLKTARERAGLTQAQLATQLGLEHRQSLASVEAGERQLSAAELLSAMSVLAVDLDYFTDSFRLVGEGQFSFRASAEVAADEVAAFEEQAGRWVATYRELSLQQGITPQWLEHKLALTPRSAYEDAQAAAHALVEQWHLGDRPAELLAAAVEHHLGTPVLYVDAPSGVSGAAWQVPGFNAILVNRAEPEGRRNFDIAHELFHLLTWDLMAPDRVDEATGKRKRVEELANNFASALLMPAPAIVARWEARDSSADLHDWLNETAVDMRVSAVACKRRLHNLRLLSKAEVGDIDEQRLVANGRPAAAIPHVPKFSEQFVRCIAVALEAGRISVKRTTSLLSLSVQELATLLRDYGFEPSFEA
jgi:Zn-dependent peptidase ImmA (M78 family)/transcriptional regulator with XRE-family HTH domain